MSDNTTTRIKTLALQVCFVRFDFTNIIIIILSYIVITYASYTTPIVRVNVFSFAAIADVWYFQSGQVSLSTF